MTGRKEQLKKLFETGKIPFGEHFAEFIEDAYNNYKIVDMYDPAQPPREFEQGVSVLVFNFDPIKNPDWNNIFNGEVAAGDIMVRTLKYSGAGVIIQEFDTLRNGRYYPNKSRIAVDEDTWGTMQDHPEVISVNNIKPNANGNIQIPTTGYLDKPVLTYVQFTPGEDEDYFYEFDINLANYNPQTDVLEFFIGNNRVDINNVQIVSYDNTKLSIKLLNGLEVSNGYPMEIWRYKYSIVSAAPTVPTITNHKRYVEVTAGNDDASVNIPGIKDGNYTYFVGLNDGIIRGHLYEVDVDEDNELFIVRFNSTLTSMSRFTIIVSVFS